jgi:2-methylisocitrate lyase-like PEP mutase family enzyme
VQQLSIFDNVPQVEVRRGDYERAIIMADLRSRLAAGGVIAPGAYDALSAVLARRAGFDTAYVSGFAFEATQLGAPDVGVSTSSELAAHVRRMSAATDLDLICDIDTGFGGPNSVHRTVRELQHAGAAALQIEDQRDPKRCPFVGGREVLDREAAVARVKIACDAREGTDLLIIARTDADVVSPDEVVERCLRFADAGADLVFPMIRDWEGVPLASRSSDDRMAIYADLVARIDHPMVALDPPPGRTAQDLFDVGVAMVILPLVTLEASMTATINCLESIRSNGSADAFVAASPPPLPANLELLNVLGLDDYLVRDQAVRSS